MKNKIEWDVYLWGENDRMYVYVRGYEQLADGGLDGAVATAARLSAQSGDVATVVQR